MNIAYTPEQLEFLKESFKSFSVVELTAMFNERYGLNKSASAIHAALLRNGFKSGRKGGDILKGRYRLVTQEQSEWIKEAYKTLTRKELTKEFNRIYDRDISVGQMTAFLKNNGFKSGRTGHYRKDNKPWNAGTVGVMKPNAGCFKKGRAAENYRPVGSERINVDGYIEIKVANPSEWRLKHRVVWEQHHGPLQKGDNVLLLDGDKTNVDIDNLQKLTDAELAIVNAKYQFSRQPRHVRESLVLLSKLDHKVKTATGNRKAAQRS